MKRVWKTVKCQGKSGKSQGILKLRISSNPVLIAREKKIKEQNKDKNIMDNISRSTMLIFLYCINVFIYKCHVSNS